MENPKRLIPSRGRAALLATACLLSPLYAGEPAGSSGLAERELAKRSAAVEEAQELLRKGDESYKAGRYAEAVEAYSGARSLIPEAPASAELRGAATERFAQASVQYGRELSKKGDVAGAKSVVDKALEVAPSDPGAVTFRSELDDPIRTNPALNADHAKKVDEVRKLLYTAEGAFNLGKYDQAKATYEQVIRLDPYNSAARRGMERVAVAKSDYYKAANDHTRAEMLSQVEAAWEMPLAPPPIDPAAPAAGRMDRPAGFVPVSNKLSRIIIPKVALEQTSLAEAVDFLRLKTSEAEAGMDQDLRGVNFTIELGNGPEAAQINALRFDLQLSSAPISSVLKYLTELTHTSYTTDDYSVIIRPHGGSDGQLITRTYKVPPDFVGSITSGTVKDAPAADPFATAPADGGLLPKRMTVQEAFAQQGVKFPDGASVSSLGNGLLRVTNTASNQDIISQIIETTVQAEPVMVAVRVTMIKSEQRNLEELGFDWLLGGWGFGGKSWIPGADKYNLSGGTQGNGGDLGDIDPLNPDPRPITAGNRSGAGAITGNSIDDLIAAGSDRSPTSGVRAPGVFKVTGVLDNETVNMLMRGLDQKKGVDLLTQPSTVTRSGQASSIHIIREFIYPTEYEPPELPDTISSTEVYLDGVFVGALGNNSFPVTPATPTAFEMRPVGVILEVLPTADANKQYVDINLNPSITNFDGFVNYGSPITSPGAPTGLLGTTEPTVITPNAILMPVFSSMKATTSLTVADGQTIVIGGLMQETIQNVEDQTPVLGSIPVVGRLFQSKAKQPVSTAIVFLVNVQLMDPTGRPFRNP